MKYSKFGLVNTNQMFQDALHGGYAVPAFNFYNMETLSAILDAARTTHSPIILAVSESALKYMGDDMLMAMISGAKIKPSDNIALHLDHGSSFAACKHAIDLGFSSVMIDASAQPFANNIDITRRVSDYAHKFDVSVESELGTLAGIEDENTFGTDSTYTNPTDVEQFVAATNTDSLAIAIGTSHGAYKRTHDDAKLRFDILSDIASRMPDFPLVLHGASNIPSDLVSIINKHGGKMQNARGIDAAQLRHATQMNICKINVDSDLRIAFTAAVREFLSSHPDTFNPRDFLNAARQSMTRVCISEIEHIMGSANHA